MSGDAILQVAQTANPGTIKRNAALFPSTDSRPVDVLIPLFSSGQDPAYDVTLINPLRIIYIEGSAENPGHGVQQAYKTK